MPSLDRRTFLAGLAGWLLACGAQPVFAPLPRGRFGPQRFRGYRGLASLPWFELDDEGRLRRAVDLPPAFDVHAHLGMALLFAPALDLLRRTPRVRHLLDCDAEVPGCELDLDVYINSNFGDAAFGRLRWKLASQFLWGSADAETHTLPNLLDEMDAVGVERAALLPIAFGLPFGDDLTGRWLDAVETAGAAGERFVRGCSVHPDDPDWRAALHGYVRRGARVLKFHPAGQRCFADAPQAMEIFEECERLGLVVFFHAGRAGIEPRSTMPYNAMRHYAEPLASFPNLRFVLGHAGARDVAEAIPLARRHRNVWLGSHGQGVSALDEILERLGPEKLVFGSDWPWYHLAASLAKLLIVTEGRPDARRLVLGGNAGRLFP